MSGLLRALKEMKSKVVPQPAGVDNPRGLAAQKSVSDWPELRRKNWFVALRETVAAT